MADLFVQALPVLRNLVEGFKVGHVEHLFEMIKLIIARRFTTAIVATVRS